MKKNGLRVARCETAVIPPSELRNSKSDGFTLIEIVMTIVLVSILAGLAAVIILQGVRAYSVEDSRSDVHYQARLAVERMAREIRMIRSATAADITAMTATNLQFNDISSNNIQFQRTGAVAPYSIVRNGNVLANNVQSVTFSYYQQDGVTVALTAATIWFVVIDITVQEASESLPMRTRVHPMNF